MVYAPIIIPTLNRKEHLQRCITSLKKNSWAKYTTLVIGVDYPPAEEYRIGYEAVCNYLREGITGFKNVKVIYHKENLGPYENNKYLKKYIEEWSDRYIFTEDDNEMSPNFIEYIDRGLDKFEKDNNVIAICSTGAESEREIEDENVVLTHNYSAHGYGTWFAKEKSFSDKINREYFERISKDIRKLWSLYQYSPSLVFACQSVIFCKEKLYQLPDRSVPVLDMTIKIYSVLENKYVVCPCIKKSRNWGYDGSGVNCPDMKLEVSENRIDERNSFEIRCKEKLRISKIQHRNSFEIKIRVLLAVLKLKLRIG